MKEKIVSAEKITIEYPNGTTFILLGANASRVAEIVFQNGGKEFNWEIKNQIENKPVISWFSRMDQLITGFIRKMLGGEHNGK